MNRVIRVDVVPGFLDLGIEGQSSTAQLVPAAGSVLIHNQRLVVVHPVEGGFVAVSRRNKPPAEGGGEA